MHKLVKQRDSLELRRARADIDITVARIGVVIAEVNAQLDRRIARDVARGKRIVEALHQLAIAGEEAMADAMEDEEPSPDVIILYHAAAMLAESIPTFHAAVQRALVQYGGLIEEEVRLTIDKLCVWAIEMPRRLRPAVDSYRDAYRKALLLSAEEQRRVAEEWVVADADGLDIE